MDGVKLAGLLVDAGPVNSPVLIEVGPAGSNASHAANPTSLHDVYARIGGAHVTMYRLFVEHYQEYEVLWNGNGGRTYFFQNEFPYDVPDQASWSSGGGTQGWAAYKVANGVTSHEAWGVGSYCFFSPNNSIVASPSFEVPDTPGVRFHDLVSVSLGGVGTIDNVINNTGGRADATTQQRYVVSYP
ncbi:hypothetical protein [Kribbella sp. NPDC048915]|uniref:hypothetical protein n=1 Tax=Kribbella sp. NPDC048915 TaxID=3155148 RepID=UPI0033F174C3